jgi:hypothetical protein
MLRKQIIGFLITLLIASPASGWNSQSKGYELYSWKQDGAWYYSVLPGTNRAKSYDEVTSAAVAKKGSKGIEKALEALPKGAEVFWRTDLHPGIKKPAGENVPLIKLPSSKKIKKVKDYCDKFGLKLTMV